MKRKADDYVWITKNFVVNCTCIDYYILIKWRKRMKIRYNGEEAMCHIGDTYTLQKSPKSIYK